MFSPEVADVVAKECRRVYLHVLLLVICSIEIVAIASTNQKWRAYIVANISSRKNKYISFEASLSCSLLRY